MHDARLGPQLSTGFTLNAVRMLVKHVCMSDITILRTAPATDPDFEAVIDHTIAKQ